jgi:SulP family sulfate permease
VTVGSRTGTARARTGLRRFVPGPADYRGLQDSWRHDVVAGVTVGVVALPLALAFAISAGLSPAVGLTTAIVAGLVAGVFGGSDLQVSGPTGAMAVVLLPVVARFGPGAVPAVGLIAGVLVLVAGVARLGRVVAYVPWPVVEGFAVGIAVIIFLQQVPAALGVTSPAGSGTAAIAYHSIVAWAAGPGFESLALVAVVAALMVGLPRLHRSIPSSLLGVIAATTLAGATGWGVTRIGALPSSIGAPTLPALGHVPQLFGPAVAVAVLAAMESLLSAKVADALVDTTPCDPDRELFGQGLASIASSVFGGMPSTGAIARTAVNARAGARSRLATIVHALTLLVVVLAAGSLVSRIPLAALAGVLMVTAVRMVDPSNVWSVLRSTRSDAAVLVLTAVATVAVNLIVAIEIGLAVAGVLALLHLARSASFTSERLSDEGGSDGSGGLADEHVLVYRIDGPLFFAVAQRFLEEFAAVSDARVVILRLADVQGLDASAAHTLGDIVAHLERRGITVLLKGIRPEHFRILEAVGSLDHLAHEHHVFADLPSAVAHARSHVARASSPDAA